MRHAIVALLFLAVPASGGTTTSFPTNDTGADEVATQVLPLVPTPACGFPVPDSWILGGSLGLDLGDFDFGFDSYFFGLLAFDRTALVAGDRHRLVLVQESFVGNPFTDLGNVIVEWRGGSLALPSRFSNPTELVAGDYVVIGSFSQSQLFASSGIEISSHIASFLSGTSPYLYLRLRFSVCASADAQRDQVRIASGVTSLARPRILAVETLFADGFESGDTSAWSGTVP